MEVWKMRDEAKSSTIRAGKSAKAGIILFALLSLLTVSPITAYAHPPKDITLLYNSASQTLEVTIVHESASPSWHYIKKVEITKNGKAIGVYEYKSQPDKSPFVYSYTAPGAPDEVLEVTATCNIYGSKAVKLTIGK
jgi:desulfoferrodoxin (superoxide reductase-like protein)